MKKNLLFYILFLNVTAINAQDCPFLIADLKKGTINKLTPLVSQEQLKIKLPCFTGESEEGGPMNCGGGVFFLKHEVYFYTGRDYIEIRKGFAGKLSIPVLGLSKNAAIATLKMGKIIRTEIDDEDEYIFFKTGYGCLFLKLVDSKVVGIDISAKKAADVELCL